MVKPRHRGITISATCDNCGAETDDAEKDGGWAYVNRTPLCPNCQKVFNKIGFALANVLDAIQENRNPDVAHHLGTTARLLHRAQTAMVES